MVTRVEELQQRLRDTEGRISRFDQRERELDAAIKNAQDQNERRRLFLEDESNTASRQSARDEYNRLVRQIKKQQGVATRSVAERYEAETGERFVSQSERNRQELVDAANKRAQEAAQKKPEQQTTNQRLLERAKQTGAQAEANYRLNQAVQQGTLKPTDIIQRGTRVPLSEQNRQAIVTAINASEAQRIARLQNTASLFKQQSALNTTSSQPSGNGQLVQTGSNNRSSIDSTSTLPNSVQSDTSTGSFSQEPFRNTFEQQIQSRRAALEQYRFSNPLGFNLASVGLGVGQTASDYFEFGKSLVFNPIKTTTQTASGVFQVAKDPRGFLVSEFDKLYQDPGYTVGQYSGDYAIGRIVSKAGEVAVKQGKNVYVAAGSKYVEPESVFDPEVLQGESVFPIQVNLRDSYKQFQEASNPNTGQIKVISTTDVFFERETKIISGAASNKGLQDPGLYVAPYGRGSPYFLKLQKENVPVTYTFNPLTVLKSNLKLPNAVVIEVDEVSIAPRSVLEKPGFGGVAEYYQTQIGQNKAFITKRSIIGDTSEVEAIIPENTQIKNVYETTVGKIKGFDEYTNVYGTNVPLRNYKIITSEEKISSLNNFQPSIQSYDLSNNLNKLPENYKTPYGYVQRYSPSYGSSSRGLSTSSYNARASSSSQGSSNGSYTPSSSSSYSVSSTSLGLSSIYRGISRSLQRGRSSSRSSGSSGGSSSSISSGLSESYNIPGASYNPQPPKEESKKKRFNYNDYNFLNSIPGFDVFVKRKGKFEAVGYNLSQAQAYDLGQDIANRTAARSFKVSPSGKTTKGDNRLPQVSSNFRKQFKKASKGSFENVLGKRVKALNNIFVEKTAKAINTSGELRQITYKGQQARRRKKRFFGGL